MMMMMNHLQQEEEIEIMSEEVSVLYNHSKCAAKMMDILLFKDIYFANLRKELEKERIRNLALTNAYSSHLECCTQSNFESEPVAVYHETNSFQISVVSTISSLHFMCERLKKEHNVTDSEDMKCSMIWCVYHMKYENDDSTIELEDEFVLSPFVFTEVLVKKELVHALYHKLLPVFDTIGMRNKHYFEYNFVTRYIAMLEKYKNNMDGIDALGKNLLQCREDDEKKIAVDDSI